MNTPLAAIRAVVDYDWQTEQRDYLEQDDEGQAGHVFNHLVAIDAWLEAQGA